MKFCAQVFAAVLLLAIQSVSASERLDDGERVYESACARCHDTGKGGAPITGETPDWDKRSHLWDAVLFEHAEKGYLSMPARGGETRLSEYEVDVAAEYMLSISNPDLPRD